MIVGYEWDGQPARPAGHEWLLLAWRRGRRFPRAIKLNRVFGVQFCGRDLQRPDLPAVLWTNATDNALSAWPPSLETDMDAWGLLGTRSDMPWFCERVKCDVLSFAWVGNAWTLASDIQARWLTFCWDPNQFREVPLDRLWCEFAPAGCIVVFPCGTKVGVANFLHNEELYPEAVAQPILTQIARWLHNLVFSERRNRLRAALMATRRGAALSGVPADVLGLIAAKVVKDPSPTLFAPELIFNLIFHDQWGGVLSLDPKRRAEAVQWVLAQ